MEIEKNFTRLCRIYSVVLLYILYICSTQFSFSGFWDGLFSISLSLICLAILGIVISDLISSFIVTRITLNGKIKNHLFAALVGCLCFGIVLAIQYYHDYD